jgi:hypothetical protein
MRRNPRPLRIAQPEQVLAHDDLHKSVIAVFAQIN